MAWVKWVAALCVLSTVWLIPASAQAPRRVALVIANSNYAVAGSLANPANDARLVADALRRAGFEAPTIRADLGNAAFRTALREFRAASVGADVALIYYAGHGIEANGRNWIIPVDAALNSELDLSDEAIDLDRVMADVSGAKRRVVILDACRNNPFGRSWSRTAHRNVTRGLGDVQVDDILVIFAAASGQLASDGPGQPNSPFAVALSKRLVQPELPLQLLGNVVRDDVLAATGREAQRPFISASMGGDLYYLMPRAPAGEKDAELERLRRQVEALQKAQVAAPVQPITTTTPTGRAPGTPFTECTGCPAMIVIPGGSFTMGSPNGVGEANEHPDVRLSVPTFAMSRTEITVAQWAACVADGVCGTPGGRLAAERRTPPANTPILGVTYNDAKNYVRWINNRLGINRYRLPSEAEWEYAARANSTGAYPWDGAAVGDHANAAGRLGARDKFDSVAPVGAFPANAFGLVDMHGNAAEWVEDCYWPNPTRTSSAALVVAAGGYCPANVLRGGAFNSAPPALRSAARGSKAHTSVESTPTIGFRIARTER